MKKSNIIIGYGNPDRGDDGVAYYIIQNFLSKKNDYLDQEIFSQEIIPLNSSTDIWFNLQLVPEIAEFMGSYHHAIFIDAHTSEIAEEIQVEKLSADFQYSPFTHHITPQTCLALTKQMHGVVPISYLVSILGNNFGFDNTLSSSTKLLADKAILKINQLLE